MIRAYNYHCQGESHKKNDNKPCQDYSVSFINQDIAIAIVSDGHGGERYFRSHFGSEFIVKIAKETIAETISHTDKTLFENKKFTQVGISKERKDIPIDMDIERTMQKMFASIITQWYEQIKEHAKKNPLDEWEEKHVPEKYQQEFNEQNRLEKNYGCTLMAYVQTPAFWFAFHIGDGKCVAFYLNEDKLEWQEPVLWDENCFLNTTTSICDSNAIEEFRYSYCGDGSFPIAVFLGSDGIDDSYGTSENLSSFYQQLMQEMANKTPQEMKQLLEESLPEISRIGSQDDMSVACVYDDEKVKNSQTAIWEYQMQVKKKQIEELNKQKETLLIKIQKLESQEDSKAKEVEMKYARNDVAKVEAEISKAEKILMSFENQIKGKELEETQKINENISHELEQTKLQKEKLYEEINEHKKSILDLQNKFSCCQDELSAKCQEISNLKQDADENKNTIHRLKAYLTCSVLVIIILLVLITKYFVTSTSTNELHNENSPEITQIL